MSSAPRGWGCRAGKGGSGKAMQGEVGIQTCGLGHHNCEDFYQARVKSNVCRLCKSQAGNANRPGSWLPCAKKCPQICAFFIKKGLLSV
eukprot:1154462-Pelagomonas_calceolata.AAC.7